MKTIFIALLFTPIVFSQDFLNSSNRSKVYISVSAGPSFPVSDYGDKNVNNERAGFAKTGYTLELSGGIRFLNFLDFSIIGFRNNNSLDLNNLINSLNNTYPGNGFKGSSDSWIIYGAMGGLGLSYPAGHNFYTDLKILGGYINCSSPEILLTASSQNNYIKIEGTSGSSLVYYFSVAIRRPLIGHLHANIGIQYTTASTKFENVKTITSINGNITESTTSFNRGMDVWGLMLGLKYFLF